MYENGYVPPILTVDSVIFRLIDDRLCVLLINRSQEPFKGAWALPGGYNAAGETTREAMDRILKTKTGVASKDLQFISQLQAFDTVARDPRGHAVTIVYLGLTTKALPEASKTTQEPQFFPVNKLPDMAYDHADIVMFALKRLQSDISHSTAISALLPKHFTLTQLQTAYEVVLGKKLDKRNFRKKFLSFDILTSTDEYHIEGAHRPAQLYTFRSRGLEEFSRSFE